MRNDAVIEPDDEDRAVLESFGGVEREQGGSVGVGERVLVSDERYIFKELIQRARGIFEREALQLLHIFPAVEALFGVIFDNVFFVIDIMHNAVEQFCDRGGLCKRMPVCEHAAEICQRKRRTPREGFVKRRLRAACEVEQNRARVRVVLSRHHVQGRESLFADTARRDVDDASEGGFIRGVVGEAHESDHVFHFAAPVKALCADELIRKARLQEGFFKQAGHRIRAVHHRAILRLKVTRSNELGDGVHDERRFTVIVTRFVEEDLLARAAVTKQAFLSAVAGAVDHAHCHVEDVLMRAVILLEQDRLRIGKVLLEPSYISIVRTAPSVHRLIGVTHAKYISVMGGEMFYQCILCKVGVLEFVHEHLTKSLGVFVTHGWVVFQ